MPDRNDGQRPAGRWRELGRRTARVEPLLWAGLVLAVLLIQWPMLKGFYYRTADQPPPPTAIEWRTDLDAAFAEARRTQKLVFVDFSADWCPPCIAMKHDVWPDPAVEQAMQSYVPVLVDVDRDATVSQRYGVRGIPTILVLDHSGRVIGRRSFLSASAMVRFLTNPAAG